MQIKSPDISDIYIDYKGHGTIERASRTNSIGHGIAHENHHLLQFRNYARYYGKEITRENISVRYEFMTSIKI